MKAPRRITQRDIARHLGVHVTTVSMALRHHASLPPRTWRRVEDAARRLHYVPDPALAALMSYRRGASPRQAKQTLAYLTCWPQRDEWKPRYSHRLLYEGAQARAAELGYGLTHEWLHELGRKESSRSRVLKTRNYAGILVAPLPSGRGHLRPARGARLDWDAFCAVKLDCGLVWPALTCVGNNQLQMMRLAIRRTRHLGYRRIGFAGRIVNNERVDRLWSAAYLDEIERSGDLERIPMLLTEDWNASTLAQWVRRHRVDAVLCGDQRTADWLEAEGLDVPDRVGWVNLDCPHVSGIQAGIHQHHEEVGSVAVDALDSLIRTNDRGLPKVARTTLVEGVWIDGATIRHPDGPSARVPRAPRRSRAARAR